MPSRLTVAALLLKIETGWIPSRRLPKFEWLKRVFAAPDTRPRSIDSKDLALHTAMSDRALLSHRTHSSGEQMFDLTSVAIGLWWK